MQLSDRTDAGRRLASRLEEYACEFTRDEIDVRVQDQVLTIEAERTAPEAKGRRHLAERSARRARRTFTLPATVEAGKAEATLRDGILHLELPKAEPQKGHKIEVK